MHIDAPVFDTVPLDFAILVTFYLIYFTLGTRSTYADFRTMSVHVLQKGQTSFLVYVTYSYDKDRYSHADDKY